MSVLFTEIDTLLECSPNFYVIVMSEKSVDWKCNMKRETGTNTDEPLMFRMSFPELSVNLGNVILF